MPREARTSTPVVPRYCSTVALVRPPPVRRRREGRMLRCSGRLEAARRPAQTGRHGCCPPPRCCCDGGAASAGDHSWAAAVVVDLCRVHHRGVDLHLAATISPIPCRTKVRRSYAVRTLASPLLPVWVSRLREQEHRTPEILIGFQHLVHTLHDTSIAPLGR